MRREVVMAGAVAAGALARPRIRERGPGAAFASMFRVVYPDVRIPGAARIVGALLAPFVLRSTHPSFRDDVLVEAEAEMAFDATGVLPDIRVPVLLVGGGNDQFFTRDVVEETAGLIPHRTLAIYEGQDHLATVSDEWRSREVYALLQGRQVDRGRQADRPASGEG